MITKITPELLSEKLNGNFWSKGDLQRIYLEKGHNTKKMTTKTYVWQDASSGKFQVSCKVDCPSQPWQWCKSQEDEVKENVQKTIDAIIEELESENVYVLSSDGSFIDYYNQKFEAGDPLYSEDVYYTEERAQSVIQENLLEAEIKTFPKAEWADMCSKFTPKETPIEEATSPSPNKSLSTGSTLQNTDNPTFGVGCKVTHPKFGIGEVILETDNQINIQFENAAFGEKHLLKAFAILDRMEE